MLMTRFVVATSSFGIMMLGADIVAGQDYPNKLIRIVTSGVGEDDRQGHSIRACI